MGACGLPHPKDEFRWSTDLVAVTQEIPLSALICRWARFTVRVAPTRVKDENGIIELAVTDVTTGAERLIARATGEFGHTGSLDPATNTGPPPRQGLQYFKIGPYPTVRHRRCRNTNWIEPLNMVIPDC